MVIVELDEDVISLIIILFFNETTLGKHIVNKIVCPSKIAFPTTVTAPR